jgi:hypothetical protein
MPEVKEIFSEFPAIHRAKNLISDDLAPILLFQLHGL